MFVFVVVLLLAGLVIAAAHHEAKNDKYRFCVNMVGGPEKKQYVSATHKLFMKNEDRIEELTEQGEDLILVGRIKEAVLINQRIVELEEDNRQLRISIRKSGPQAKVWKRPPPR